MDQVVGRWLKTKRKRRRWSGRNWLKNDQKVILLEKPMLVCEEGSITLVQYHRLLTD